MKLSQTSKPPPTANIAFLITIAIWSTTPLAIKWSNDSLPPIAAVSLRIALACVLAWIVCVMFARSSLLKKRYIPSYLAATLGIFPNMPLVYLAANYIPSGLISVLFAMAPFFTGLVAWLCFNDKPFSPRQIIALLIAMSGLFIVFKEQLNLNDKAIFGFIAMLGSNVCFAVSSVFLKRLEAPKSAFEQTLGAMTMALPGMLIVWLIIEPDTFIAFASTSAFFDSNIDLLSTKSAFGIVYLALIGSLAGFMCYFFVVKNLTITAIATMPLISPIAALWFGHIIDGEALSVNIMFGTGTIVLALVIFEGKLAMTLAASIKRYWRSLRVIKVSKKTLGI
jgi:drug/metabolite transporter (DMT)-like permease